MIYMSNFISTYTIDPMKINNIVDFDCLKKEDWEESICENEGHFSRKGEFISFDLDGFYLTIFYDLEVSGKVDYDPGDYWTPPYSDFEITYEDINVSEVTLDDYNIELTEDLIKLFSEVIKNNL
jgi:hypothetical protein